MAARVIEVLTPHDYQAEDAEWAIERERVILAHEPGLGKSLIAMMAARGRTLIVAPAMMYESGDWVDELDKWRHLLAPDLDVTFTTYGQVPRRLAGKNGRLSRMDDFPKKELRGPWDTLIVDEAHYLRTRDAHWTQAIQRIKAQRLFLLTGTPVPNWSHEIFSLLRTLFPKDERFSNYRRWLETWFDTQPAKFGGPYSIEVVGLKPGLSGKSCHCTISPGRLLSCSRCWQVFRDANSITSNMRRRTWDDVGIQLPPRQEQWLHIPMTPAQAKLYKDLAKDYYARVEATGKEISAWSVGGLHTKLAQVTAGIPVLDPDFEGRGSGKLERLREILDDRQGSSVIIGCQFRRSVEMVAQAARGMGRRTVTIMGGDSQRGAKKKAFQAGDVDTLVGTLDSISEAIQLQRANTVILFEHSWRPDRNEQFIRRAWRMGQTQNVLVIHMVTKDSIDERIQKVLAEKTADQIQLMSAREFAALL